MNATGADHSVCVADEIALLAAQVDVGMHRLLTCIRRFDQSEEWARHGARSCAEWLAWRIGLVPGAAREKVRVARALGRFAGIDEAMSTGRLSYAKVRALTRVATAANEARLVEIALATTGAQLERVCRRFRRTVDEGALSDVQHEWDPSGGERGIRVRTTEAGLVRIEATLDPAEAALVLAAIEKARDELRAATGAVTATTGGVSAETRGRVAEPATPGRADGLIAIAERTLAPAPAEQTQRGTGGGAHHVHQVVIHLDQAVLGPDGAREAFLDDGTQVSAQTFRRVSCDGALVAVTTGEGGAVLDVGRQTRVVPAAIRRALWARDRGCRFPMCSNRRFVDAHHVRHWAHGGRTSLDNLVLLCGFHHRLLHEGGFRVSLDATGAAPRFFTPAGAEIAPVPDVPTVSRPGPSPVDDPDANPCGWDGEPVDYDAAVDALIAA
jgi:Domain of unknown function (DUF222)/HNH endonuclease